MGKTIYIADDDTNIRNLVQSFLMSEGYSVLSFQDGDSLLKHFESEEADLVILDVMMPGRDGFFICSELRKISNVPIIMLTARDSDADYISGLSLGSDDYFTKPFSPIKLLTKVRAIFRRIDADNIKPHSHIDKFGDMIINKNTKTVHIGDAPIKITPNEYNLLSYLVINRERAVSRIELLDKLWGFNSDVETRVADDTVKRLRKKLRTSNVNIKTVWGFGFRLILNNKESKIEDT